MFKRPSRNQWGQFFKILSKKEKLAFFAFFALLLAGATFISGSFYLKNTEIVPAQGKTFIEGAVGQPRFINPIYASSNDIDRDLLELIFSGIMKYDESGQIIDDLGHVEIENEGKAYRVKLKENILWSDSNSSSGSKQLTVDDIIFTIQTIQNPEYKSSLRVKWLDITMEKISDLEMIFKLKNPYSAFLENLTLKILPKHIWQDLSSQDFPLSIYNLKPVASGPYMIDDLQQNGSGRIEQLSLKINSNYFAKKPYLSIIKFKFFENEDALINSARKGEIDGFSLLENHDFSKNSLFNEYGFSMPRYFAVFFNPDKSNVLSDKNVRLALNYGTDKNEIIETILGSKAISVDSPILPEIYGFNPPEKIYGFDLEKAKQILEDAGFKETESGIREKSVNRQPAFQFKSTLQSGSSGSEVQELQKCLAKFSDVYPEGTISGSFGALTKAAVIRFQEKYANEILKPYGYTSGTGSTGPATREKLNEVCFALPEEKLALKISLVTVGQSALSEISEILKSQWEKLGAEVQIQTFDISVLEKEIIKPRNYEAILFGEAMGKIADPYPFWDSVQKKDPGLNLALYENKNADKLLEDARQSLDESERKEKLEDFQNILIADAPCVFLYSPDYSYFVSNKVKGIKTEFIVDPSKRFSNIENWYIKTKRAWK